MSRTRDDLSFQIGQRLRSARQQRGLSLQELSDLTADVLSKSRISNYEQGIRRMGIEESQVLAAALANVHPAYLLCLDDTDFLTEEERALVERYRQTDDQGRVTIHAVAEAEVQRTRGTEL